MKIVVGSQNPVKVAAAKETFAAYFSDQEIECFSMDSPSGVADQPMTAEETRLGAVNRVTYCQTHADADYFVAMEGGVDKFEYGPCTFAYVVISDGQQLRVGRSAILPIPESVYVALEHGEELGHVMDRLFNTTNIKQKGGAIGLLTNGLQTRGSAYTQALTLAMAPFIHPDFYAS